ncbi:GRAM domain-containing protein [Aquimarina algicola]|uniref:GRAM domain-containing protein n=1 Tax=Aquimarina algicola TaxID=2589995 RepID=A0A504IUY4_9FLAO|nr:GRAM domain-containing protein [Aquimarina algicola]TPN82297.1 hypothetical protein FHK87_23010 [Aquimarina algicola]
MFTVKLDVLEDEIIEFAVPANHFVGIEGVGGKLFVTNKRIVFKSHNFNIQNHQLVIDYSNIKTIELSNTLGIIPNGLKIILQNNQIEKFVVQKRKTIQKAIHQKMGIK